VMGAMNGSPYPLFSQKLLSKKALANAARAFLFMQILADTALTALPKIQMY